MKKRVIEKAVNKMLKGYDPEFVSELSRLLKLYHHDFYINNPKRLAMFLAHVKAEVDVTKSGKVKMRESMNYSCKRLQQVFRRFRKNPNLARKYGRCNGHKANQKMIANIAYANRLGNRGIESGDGWRYRGAGILQSTGRDLIRQDAKTIRARVGINLLDKDGEVYDGLLDTYTVGILMGMADWYRSRMYAAETIDDSTRIINRYTDSYGKRRKYYAKALKAIGSAA